MPRRFRVWGTALVACCAVLLTACGGAAASGGSGPSGEPIKIGLLGWFSGIAGPTHLPKKQTYEAWAEAVNQAGGINGHPVEVLAVDHGGNQAQAATAARDLIDNKGIVALSVTGSVEGGAVAYARERGVPVIGISAGPPDQQDNPFMFKTGPDYQLNAANLAGQVKAAGFTKIAAFYCTEGAACKANVDQAKQAMAPLGIEVVFEAAISLSAPDYTAECIQARDSGAQAIYPVGNTGTPQLIADSCVGQDYRVPMVIGSAAAKQAQDENLDGSLAVLTAFPWFLTEGSPGVDEFVTALREVAPELLADDGTSDVSNSWVAAKAFQAAATAAFPAGATPTPQALLTAVHQIKDFDVDGLMPGCMSLTFAEGQNASSVAGSFAARIEGGKWVAPDGLTPLCVG